MEKPTSSTLTYFDFFKICEYIEEKYDRKGMKDRIMDVHEFHNDTYDWLWPMEYIEDGYYCKESEKDMRLLYEEFPEQGKDGMHVHVSW